VFLPSSSVLANYLGAISTGSEAVATSRPFDGDVWVAAASQKRSQVRIPVPREVQCLGPRWVDIIPSLILFKISSSSSSYAFTCVSSSQKIQTNLKVFQIAFSSVPLPQGLRLFCHERTKPLFSSKATCSLRRSLPCVRVKFSRAGCWGCKKKIAASIDHFEFNENKYT
jgi:hypothetical protein